MRNLPERRILIRWMFEALGWLLIFGHNFVIRYVLQADFWGQLFFGRDTAGYAFLSAAFHLYIVPTALLCWITSAGLKRNRRWSFAVGVVTSALLLLGFPWLTIAGGFGLYVLTATASQPVPAPIPVPTRAATDFWDRKRKSKAQRVVASIFWIAALGALGWFTVYAHKAGLPITVRGWEFWLWYFVFIFFNTVLHEAGHAVVAWAAGFKLRIVSVGPFTFWREHSRLQFRFNPARLFEQGGYMGAVPVSDRNLREYEIAVAAGGPITNAITCLVFLAVFFSLPGTEWQNCWWIAAFNAVIAGVMAVTNLMPLGYCDGTMVFHMLFQTRAGRLLLDIKRVQQNGAQAEECHGRAEFDKELELKQAMLERALPYGQDCATLIALCYQTLGSTYADLDDWPSAEFHYGKCLSFEGELAANPGLAGNVWSGLHLTRLRRHQGAAVGPAYSSTVAILEKQKKSAAAAVTGPAVTFVMLAQAHQRGGDFEAALRETAQALKSLPRNSSLRGYLFRIKAICHLGRNEIDAGLAAARTAADLFRSAEAPPGRRNLGSENVAYLGCELWRAGQSDLPIGLLREGIAHLESGGALAGGAQYRIKLAAILRQLGRFEEANLALPPEQEFPPILRRAFLAESAQLRMATGHPGPAVADCRELVGLWRAHPCAPGPEIASAEALLAKACLAAGEIVEAESLALQAADVLGSWQHPDAAGCLITVALARLQVDGEHASDLVRNAFREIEDAALLSPAEKARMRDAEAARVEQSPAASAVLAGTH